MAQNLQLDPTKRDYVVVNGSPVASDRVEEASYIALAIPQGAWLYGTADQGSLLWTLEQKRLTTTEQKYASYATDALKRQLIDKGLASAAQVGNIAASRTGTSNQIEVIPSAKQVSTQFNFNAV
jgi:phage gp46-like protein